MSAEPRLRPRPSTARASSRCRSQRRGRRAAVLAAAATLAVLAFGASASIADTGSVYVDGRSNVGVGHGPFFNGTFTGIGNGGLGYAVMSNLTGGDTAEPVFSSGPRRTSHTPAERVGGRRRLVRVHAGRELHGRRQRPR